MADLLQARRLGQSEDALLDTLDVAWAKLEGDALYRINTAGPLTEEQYRSLSRIIPGLTL